MARYYQTADPQFVDNFIYTPPYELMLQVANQKQTQYDKAIASAKILGDVKIDHLNGEYDVANVQEKQRYYNDRANSIIEGIRKDPLNVNGYIGEIDNLQKEIKTDFTSGEISKITGSKAALTKWEEQNKERLKDSPARYEAARNAFFRNWGGNSLESQWKGELVTQDVDWNKIYDAAEKIKASEYTQESAGPSGGYIWKNKTTNQRVTEEELMNNILGRVLTSDNLSSLQQSERIGVGKYFKEDGTPDITYDENGKIVNSASGWIPSRLFANSAAYNVNKQESDVQSDGTAMTYVREAGANQRQQAGFAHDKAMKEFDFQLDQIKEANKSKEAKIDALDMKIAEAQIAGDDKAVSYWENAKNNITGNTGIFNSVAGSVYGDIGALQTRSVAGDVVAQKHIDQTLVPMLKQAGINFNDPKEKKIAQEVVGLVKQNKLDVGGIEDYISKKIATTYKAPSKDQVMLRAKALKADADRINSVLMQPSKNKPVTSYVKQAEEELKTTTNVRYKRNLTEKLTTAFNNWDKDWKESKSNFSTAYEVVPLDIRGQSTIKSQLRDPEIASNIFIEKDGKREPYSTSGIKLENITGMVGINGNREHGIIGMDANGKQYKLSGDSNNPIFKSLINNTAASINPSTPVGYQIKYPIVNRLAQIIQGSKRMGNNTVRQTINVGGNNYTMVIEGDRVTAIDPKGQVSKGNYIEIGQAIDELNK